VPGFATAPVALGEHPVAELLDILPGYLLRLEVAELLARRLQRALVAHLGVGFLPEQRVPQVAVDHLADWSPLTG
jgi:hypothetical protein